MLVKRGYPIAHLHGRRQYRILQSTGKLERITLYPLKKQKISSRPIRLEKRGSHLFTAEGIGERVESRDQSYAAKHFRLQVL